jgi:hypothetical protein
MFLRFHIQKMPGGITLKNILVWGIIMTTSAEQRNAEELGRQIGNLVTEKHFKFAYEMFMLYRFKLRTDKQIKKTTKMMADYEAKRFDLQYRMLVASEDEA